jgi:hypothetical protein
MTHYVGAISPVVRELPDGRVVCTGYLMDNARGVKFWATMEALNSYIADTDEDRCMVVDDLDITWLSSRDGGRSLWSCAGLT